MQVSCEYCENVCTQFNMYTYTGLLWTKQFFHYIVETWLEGDSKQPKPPESRQWGRNAREWKHLYNKDIISMPDKWEYPWVSSLLYSIEVQRVNALVCSMPLGT